MIQIALGLILAGASAAYDYGKIFKNHKYRWSLRFGVSTLFALIGGYNINLYLANFFIITAIFYGIFDYMLNIFEGRFVGYIGDTAEWDKLRKKLYGKYIVEIDFVSKLTLIAAALTIKICITNF